MHYLGLKDTQFSVPHTQPQNVRLTSVHLMHLNGKVFFIEFLCWVGSTATSHSEGLIKISARALVTLIQIIYNSSVVSGKSLDNTSKRHARSFSHLPYFFR